ncbi:hypothetical protein KFE25_002573 [Diacronema lutheri]|uniref:Zeta-carotene desaturase, chloroplastic/chromoplastic n=2 Tax=Diacronema lutheri TaxID=2081491 RepID=A0A8J5XB03_DIALT|nr:hypothetical protein KFE25_002573 [Diacronema lutheri]
MLASVLVGAALAHSRAGLPRGSAVRGAAASRGHARAVLERTQLGDKDRLLDTSLTERALRGPTVRAKDGRRLKVGIVGAGLGGMVTAMDLSEAGYDVEMFEARRFVGGKVSSWLDKDGNHIEMGLHVFFGCYYNLFGIMKRVGAFEPGLRLKDHRHIFVNKGGSIGELDFRMGGIGAPLNGLKAFATSAQLDIGDKIANALALGNPISCPIVQALVDFDGGMDRVRALDDVTFSEWFEGSGGSRGSIKRLWDPIAYALGFIDCDHISARCMLTIFQLFAVRSEASVLRMCEGSPDTYLHKPIVKYLTDRGVKINLKSRVLDILHDVDANGAPTRVHGICVVDGNDVQSEHRFDVTIAATDVPGIKGLLPDNFRKLDFFDKVYQLEGVPVATVQLRFDGWVTELADMDRWGMTSRGAPKDVGSDRADGRAPGIDNLLYSADADFSCFADLALTSPADYYKPGEGSLLQCVLTPADKYMAMDAQEVADRTLEQVYALFPSAKAQGLKCTWSNVVKLAESLYNEKPGMDRFRPSQQTPIPNFFMAGSFTYQDYIDSMEGATKSGLACAEAVLSRADALAAMADESAGAQIR